MPELVLYTIGHGSRGLREFVALLLNARIALLVDVRAYPASRRYRHFSPHGADSRGTFTSYFWDSTLDEGQQTHRLHACARRSDDDGLTYDGSTLGATLPF